MRAASQISLCKIRHQTNIGQAAIPSGRSLPWSDHRNRANVVGYNWRLPARRTFKSGVAEAALSRLANFRETLPIRQRQSGRPGADRQNGLERLRTFVTGARPAAGGGKPHVIVSRHGRYRRYALPSDALREQLGRRQRLGFRHNQMLGHAECAGEFNPFCGHSIAVAHLWEIRGFANVRNGLSIQSVVATQASKNSVSNPNVLRSMIKLSRDFIQPFLRMHS
jgi:hypothetical protein